MLDLASVALQVLEILQVALRDGGREALMIINASAVESRMTHTFIDVVYCWCTSPPASWTAAISFSMSSLDVFLLKTTMYSARAALAICIFESCATANTLPDMLLRISVAIDKRLTGKKVMVDEEQGGRITGIAAS